MIWSFQRGDERTTCQLRADPRGPGYDFVVVAADEHETTERFASSQRAFERWTALEQELLHKGWTGPHGQ